MSRHLSLPILKGLLPPSKLLSLPLSDQRLSRLHPLERSLAIYLALPAKRRAIGSMLPHRNLSLVQQCQRELFNWGLEDPDGRARHDPVIVAEGTFGEAWHEI